MKRGPIPGAYLPLFDPTRSDYWATLLNFLQLETWFPHDCRCLILIQSYHTLIAYSNYWNLAHPPRDRTDLWVSHSSELYFVGYHFHLCGLFLSTCVGSLDSHLPRQEIEKNFTKFHSNAVAYTDGCKNFSYVAIIRWWIAPIQNCLKC